MSRDKPWFKMWAEWLGDAKMDRLSLAEQGAWWRLVTLAHECGHTDETGKLDGALIVADIPLSLAEIMKSLKITEALDKAVFNQMMEKMKIAGSLHWNGNVLYVIHYEERQRATTDTKVDRARRQRERREALKAEKEQLPRGIGDPSPIDIEEESKRREAEEETHAQSGHEKSVTQAQGVKSGHEIPVTAELSRCYERYIGLLNPLDADRMREFAEYYESHEGKIDWVEEAFMKAPVNKRRWPYIQAILERYIEEGGPDGRSGQQLKDERGGAHETDRRGASEPAPKHKWKVKRSGPESVPGGEENR